MAQKRFLSWLGFNDGAQDARVGQDPEFMEEKFIMPQTPAKPSSSRPSTSGRAMDGVESSSPVARIRELEAELADLRSRRDLTSLTKEEFEILATETAVALVRTAQARESRAVATAQKIMNESTRSAQSTIQSAEETARQVLATADQRGKRVLSHAEEAAKRVAKETEQAAEQRVEEARRDAEGIINSKKREASSLIALARKNAEELIGEATQEVTQYKNWLTTSLAESERLYRTQMNSLNGAHVAIEDAKSRLSHSFNSLKAMHEDIFERSEVKRSAGRSVSEDESEEFADKHVKSSSGSGSRPNNTKSSAAKSAAKKSSAKKSAGKASVTKQSSAKRSATKKSATKR